VYRSDDHPEEPRQEPQPFEMPSFDAGVLALSAQLLAHAMATVATGFALSVTVAALPLTLSRRALGSMSWYRSG